MTTEVRTTERRRIVPFGCAVPLLLTVHLLFAFPGVVYARATSLECA